MHERRGPVGQHLASLFKFTVSFSRFDLGRFEAGEQLLKLSATARLASKANIEFALLGAKRFLLDADLSELSIDLVKGLGSGGEVGIVRIEKRRCLFVGGQQLCELGGRGLEVGVATVAVCCGFGRSCGCLVEGCLSSPHSASTDAPQASTDAIARLGYDNTPRLDRHVER